MLHHNKGDFEQAERYYGRALETKRTAPGARHPDVAGTGQRRAKRAGSAD